MNPTETLHRNFNDAQTAIDAILIDRGFLGKFEEAANLLVHAYRQGGRLYVAGNGGSAADSQHLAAEFVSKLARDRDPLPAEALTTDSSIITAIGNDYGYEQVFARQIQAKASSKDVFLGITTSGASLNIVFALRKCREMGVPTVVLSGRGGGEAARLADVALVVPSSRTSTIQEMHIALAHSLCEYVEHQICFS